MAKLLLITTGGTIASKPTSDSGLLASGAMSGTEVAQLCQLPPSFELQVLPLFQLPSLHLASPQLLELKAAIQTAFEDPELAGIVVTHGTDSLEETAYFLDVTIHDSRPIVVTGSQRAPGDIGSDVYSNLRNSMFVAVHPSLEDAGTVVVFNERIWAARYAKKVHASNTQGFESFGYGYLGIIDHDVVTLYQKPLRRDVFRGVNHLPRVDIVKCFTNADSVALDAFCEAGTKGLVIEGMGRGQVPPDMVQGIQRAIKLGVVVVITTSAEEGQVFPAYDYKGSAHQLETMGAVLGKDYDSKKARIKLQAVLASGISPEKAFGR
ncbi:asparaginase [Aureibacillus halotolerans]|uniref:asparaginase n=1 Tax=Aureibacillus halotolerans TaxID=1508390 RepID=A0A4R6U9A3_9BACI|nr:asparaginase [Aureibacillus halotolerans]TDQ41553.1 L-asparaginase [Aureibacillus halotolerans]